MSEKVIELHGAKEMELLEWEASLIGGKLTLKVKSPAIEDFFKHASGGAVTNGDFGKRYRINFYPDISMNVFLGDCGGSLYAEDGLYNLSWLATVGLRDGLVVNYTDVVPWSSQQSLMRAVTHVVRGLYNVYLKPSASKVRISVTTEEDADEEGDEA